MRAGWWVSPVCQSGQFRELNTGHGFSHYIQKIYIEIWIYEGRFVYLKIIKLGETTPPGGGIKLKPKFKKIKKTYYNRGVGGDIY
jgi:hypothetical protein